MEALQAGLPDERMAPLGRATIVALAALACGGVAASLGWLVVMLLEAGSHRVVPVNQMFLMAMTDAGPMGILFAIPGALVAPWLTRNARLWPTVPATFVTAVVVTAVATYVTGTYGLIVLAPIAGYVAGFTALVVCARAHPRAPGSGVSSG